jgi:hypothetical protein
MQNFILGGNFMNKLNKNFSEKVKTVEAMINACGGQPSGCMCDSMIDCACDYENHTQKQNKYSDWYKNYTSAFRKATL